MTSYKEAYSNVKFLKHFPSMVSLQATLFSPSVCLRRPHEKKEKSERYNEFLNIKKLFEFELK